MVGKRNKVDNLRSRKLVEIVLWCGYLVLFTMWSTQSDFPICPQISVQLLGPSVHIAGKSRQNLSFGVDAAFILFSQHLNALSIRCASFVSSSSEQNTELGSLGSLLSVTPPRFHPHFQFKFKSLHLPFHPILTFFSLCEGKCFLSFLFIYSSFLTLIILLLNNYFLFQMSCSF